MLRAFALLACLAATAPAAAAPVVTQLANGLTVVLESDSALSECAVDVTYRAGWRDEARGQRGYAGLVENLLERVDVDGAVPDRAEALGWSTRSFSAPDRTAFSFWGPPEGLGDALRAEAERLIGFGDALTDELLAEVAAELAERVRALGERPQEQARRLLLAGVYGEHPYVRPADAWRADLQLATRDAVLTFHRQHFGVDQAAVTIVGPQSVGDMLAAVRAAFTDDAPRVARLARVVPPDPDGVPAPWSWLKSDEARVQVAWRVDGMTPSDAAALEAAAEALLGDGAGLPGWRGLWIPFALGGVVLLEREVAQGSPRDAVESALVAAAALPGLLDSARLASALQAVASRRARQSSPQRRADGLGERFGAGVGFEEPSTPSLDRVQRVAREHLRVDLAAVVVQSPTLQKDPRLP